MAVQRRSLSLKSKRPSTMQVALYILQKEGLLGLYSGAKAALVLVINPIIQYAIFEKAKQKVQDKRPLTGLDFFFLGAFSKLCATIIMYPYM
jgi:adenine nucleotide transporter 17